jgi:hypothetical protein
VVGFFAAYAVDYPVSCPNGDSGLVFARTTCMNRSVRCMRRTSLNEKRIPDGEYGVALFPECAAHLLDWWAQPPARSREPMLTVTHSL